MHKSFLKIIIYILIGTSVVQLTSCSTPQKYITVDASILQQGMDQKEVYKLLDYPDAVTLNKDNGEEWYYYNDHSHFWQKIPFVGKHLGNRMVEVLKITFKNSKVLKWIYYNEKISE